MIRVDITRKQFASMAGRLPDPFSVGVVWYDSESGQPVFEYLFTDEASAKEVTAYKREQRYQFQHVIQVPWIPRTSGNRFQN